MKVLLAQNMVFHRTHGGASKSNRILMEELAARGHDCRVVAPAGGVLARTDRPALLADLAGHDVRVERDTAVAEIRGVRAHLVLEAARLVAEVRRVAGEFRPDWTIVPSDDPGSLMLGTAHGATPGRVVYLVHTLQQLPFGPGAFYPSLSSTRLVRRAAAVIAVSRAAQDHLRTWAEIESTLLHPHVYGRGPHPRHNGDAVIMINPCGYKGLAIFLGLADACPEVRFLAVPTWGTSDEDRTALARRPNIEIAEATDDIDEILVRGRVVVMPSLWDETFGYTAVEAMLRGIPVLAADIGGLTEAKLGVPYSLPVRRIETYAAHGGQGRPTPQIAEQDIRPWLAALRALLTDPDHHADIARRSRTAATAFVESLDAGALENLLLGLRPTLAGPPAGRDGLPADRHRLAALARLSTKER